MASVFICADRSSSTLPACSRHIECFCWLTANERNARKSRCEARACMARKSFVSCFQSLTRPCTAHRHAWHGRCNNPDKRKCSAWFERLLNSTYFFGAHTHDDFDHQRPQRFPGPRSQGDGGPQGRRRVAPAAAPSSAPARGAPTSRCSRTIRASPSTTATSAATPTKAGSASARRPSTPTGITSSASDRTPFDRRERRPPGLRFLLHG